MATDDMFFCKVPFQDIHITTANVCRAPSCIKIVHERHYYAARFYSILLFNNNLYLCSVIEHVTEHLALNSSKTFGQRIKDAVNLQRTVTFGDGNGIFKVEQFGSGEYSWNRPIKCVLHPFRGHSKVILNRFQSKQQIVMRIVIEFRNNLKATSGQVEVCTDTIVGYSA